MIETYRDTLISNGYKNVARVEKWDILLGHFMYYIINHIPDDLLPQDMRIDYQKLLANLEDIASSGYADEMVEAWEILGLLYASDPKLDEKTLQRGAWYAFCEFFFLFFFLFFFR
jgi:hypothetical protein